MKILQHATRPVHFALGDLDDLMTLEAAGTLGDDRVWTLTDANGALVAGATTSAGAFGEGQHPMLNREVSISETDEDATQGWTLGAGATLDGTNLVLVADDTNPEVLATYNGLTVERACNLMAVFNMTSATLQTAQRFDIQLIRVLDNTDAIGASIYYDGAAWEPRGHTVTSGVYAGSSGANFAAGIGADRRLSIEITEKFIFTQFLARLGEYGVVSALDKASGLVQGSNGTDWSAQTERCLLRFRAQQGAATGDCTVTVKRFRMCVTSGLGEVDGQ